MQIFESGDDSDEPRFSNGSVSCLFPTLTNNNSPRKSLSYDKLHQQPLRLRVLKLDGTFFEIEVANPGTVGELKNAVELAFCHLPKKGPGKVSWINRGSKAGDIGELKSAVESAFCHLPKKGPGKVS
ncbi:hypothetical protein OROGR_027218 [Orobanche gracilis]